MASRFKRHSFRSFKLLRPTLGPTWRRTCINRKKVDDIERAEDLAFQGLLVSLGADLQEARIIEEGFGFLKDWLSKGN